MLVKKTIAIAVKSAVLLSVMYLLWMQHRTPERVFPGPDLCTTIIWILTLLQFFNSIVFWLCAFYTGWMFTKVKDNSDTSEVANKLRAGADKAIKGISPKWYITTYSLWMAVVYLSFVTLSALLGHPYLAVLMFVFWSIAIFGNLVWWSSLKEMKDWIDKE